MNRLYKKLHKLLLLITGSIALWPSVIAVSFLLLSFFISYFERTHVGVYLEQNFLSSLNSEPENARSILTTIVSGTISLMVFSFSMVMIVLSQASSNLTPRVIPGLISDKMNQLVLGVNIGTILYTLILILSFKQGEDNASVPMIGILLAMLFAVCCVVLFVYFIHSISRAIQPNTILTRIYETTKAALEEEAQKTQENEELKKQRDPESWYAIHSTEGGYLRVIELESLNKLAQQEDLIFEITVSIGKFIVPGFPFVQANRDLQDQEELREEVQNCFIFSLEEVPVVDFENGLRQISEVAVKALSPGINDPGTALSAIDFLTLLFIKRMQSITHNGLLDENRKLRVIKRPTPLETLLYRFFTPIRTYGKADVMVVRKLLLSLRHMLHADKQRHEYTQGLYRQVRVIRDDAHESITNPEDRN
ncbi:DUF2254 domain-containing protein [Rufibacter sediminis]|uniref:DUF2254 domain-containing protein n=1 Tax=Rufibacter sediminis TaxID=2762756 RepID=A0ABR6VR53_9BACT|nr:DUF2254 domain-containing protein [Rufibacter sediminis]MBC3539333.1 DUF2254 domain-containing protein [Rufibacter sediminis]